MMMGVTVEAGQVKQGTPVCVPSKREFWVCLGMCLLLEQCWQRRSEQNTQQSLSFLCLIPCGSCLSVDSQRLVSVPEVMKAAELLAYYTL